MIKFDLNYTLTSLPGRPSAPWSPVLPGYPYNRRDKNLERKGKKGVECHPRDATNENRTRNTTRWASLEKSFDHSRCKLKEERKREKRRDSAYWLSLVGLDGKAIGSRSSLRSFSTLWPRAKYFPPVSIKEIRAWRWIHKNQKHVQTDQLTAKPGSPGIPSAPFGPWSPLKIGKDFINQAFVYPIWWETQLLDSGSRGPNLRLSRATVSCSWAKNFTFISTPEYK